MKAQTFAPSSISLHQDSAIALHTLHLQDAIARFVKLNLLDVGDR